jgi:uncharacterized protein YceH (UPF0502 family)
MSAAPQFAPLSPIEARVLGVLVEKRHTVPDTYPLTLNALVAGCNQKTSRDPVMDVSDADAHVALDVLRVRSMVIESSGGRVMRYEENARRVLGVPSESVALLATLMLRGPQTAAELRANCERIHRFSDVSATEGYLEELAARSPHPYVVRLARQPGSREGRWAHLLCGEPDEPRALTFTSSAAGAQASGASPQGASAAFEALVLRVERLESELAALRARLGEG